VSIRQRQHNTTTATCHLSHFALTPNHIVLPRAQVAAGAIIGGVVLVKKHKDDKEDKPVVKKLKV